MNVITRGIRNALRSPVRSGAIVIMLAISVGLILAMLVARTSVNAKVAQVKATTATGITISPAGFGGGLGGGNPLTTAQVKTITDTAHINSVTANLTDQLGSTDTNLTPSLNLGSLGKRIERFDSQGASGGGFSADGGGNFKAPTPRTSVTGTNNPSALATSTSDQLTSGTMINGSSSDDTALVGKDLASKNNLSVGSTFTAYGSTITVKGIFSSGNTFQDSSIVMPLATVQTLTSQPGAVSSVTATADSSDNVANAVNSLKSSLGSAADITSQQTEAENSLQPLEGIASLALAGVIAATIAGAVIILLSMIMIVRERRREIGVIKAIGGTNAKVITQFITEALTLTVIGGAVGLALGVAVSGPLTQSLVANSQTSSSAAGGTGFQRGSGGFRGGFLAAGTQLKSSVKNVTSTVTPQVFFEGIGIILLIAIVGSAVPAWAIARVRPAEVLRTE
jgi:putative ABC transport system permease protein